MRCRRGPSICARGQPAGAAVAGRVAGSFTTVSFQRIWVLAHADLFAFDRIAERRLFAEDRAEDKIADQRVELGSAARELAREGPRQRHRRHRLFGPRVGDRLADGPPQ